MIRLSDREIMEMLAKLIEIISAIRAEIEQRESLNPIHIWVAFECRRSRADRLAQR